VLGAVRPEMLFLAYLSGYNLAEAYLATAALSWHLVVVGDPLAAPFAPDRVFPVKLTLAKYLPP
jgi:hypothetical protein